jgi:hypothetical protein
MTINPNFVTRIAASFTIHTENSAPRRTLHKVALRRARWSLDLNRWNHGETDA